MNRLVLLVSCILICAMTFAAEPGLVGHWRFDAPGPQVPDLSGKGHPATLAGGEIMTDGDRRFLHMDGQTRLEVPSAPEFNVRPGFSIETRLRPTDLRDGRLLVFKDNEYLLRIDWPVEGSRLSWFVHEADGWEPRASAPAPVEGQWLHVVAIWDGLRLTLWVNGLPYTQTKQEAPPQATTNPLVIASTTNYGAGLIGDLEYVKIYNRALTTTEVIKAAYGTGGGPLSPLTAQAGFDFTKGLGGWLARDGQARVTPAGVSLKTSAPSTSLLHDNLNADISRLDYLTLRMTADQGSTATLVFVTSAGAGRVPLPIQADGKPHTYLLEPWQTPGWGGKLMMLGLLPSDALGATATIRYLKVTAEPEGEGELLLEGLNSDTTLPRVGRPEKLTLRLRNTGGPAKAVKVTLQAPKGVTLQGPATQTLPALAYGQQQELTWTVQARQAGMGDFRATATGQGTNTAALTTRIGFLPALKLPKAAYVPEPKPVDTGPYEIWTHYCPLWKTGTHYGWGKIEPYPERKPVLGWYNEGTPEVADWHIKYWLEHGISGVVYCWYRSSINGPVTQSIGHALHDGLLKAKYLPMMKFGIMWENGCGAGTESADDLLSNVLPFWLDNYFTNPSYIKIDGKPVLYVWVPGNVTKNLGGSDKVKIAFDKMRAKCRERGLPGLYLVACAGGANKEALQRMAAEGWDATSAYGNGWIPPKDSRRSGNLLSAPAEGFIPQQEAIWKAKQEIGALPDITAAMMGWDARPWGSSQFYWSDNTPEKFRELCLRAKAVMDSRPGNGPERENIIFCCWNEFGEGHYIEPTRGYGFSYIDTIRDVFSKAPRAHTDVAPEDVGLGPYDSWYQQAKQTALKATPLQTAWTGADVGAWGATMGIRDLQVKDGVLRLVAATRDPALSSPALRVRGNRFSRVVVEMRVSQASGAQLFWTNTAEPRANERASIRLQTVADGQFHKLVYEVGKNETWGGCVTGFRFDPTDVEGAVVEIKSITLE
ncbi:MAG: LamG-like jellyroll fold domain-containing protein [Armatimonadia bacterium]